MEKQPPIKMTPFDAHVTTDLLQTMKLMIPYLPPDIQRMAGIYAKLTEFQNAITYFQPPYYHNSRRGRLRQKELTMDVMMEELSPYLPPETSGMMGQAVQMMSMVQMMQNMDMEDMMQSMNMGEQKERMDEDERMDGESLNEESRSGETGADSECAT